jgi:predicted Zn finger-like uncharacterized protein
MITQCASCQTRFKIGDDKVTERGVKVRCSKCGTVFVVRKGDAGAPPATPDETPSPAADIRPATMPPTPAQAAMAAAAAAPKPAPGRTPSRPPPAGTPPGLLDDLFGQLDLGQGGANRAPAPSASPSPESVFGAAPVAPSLSSASAATTGLDDIFGGSSAPAPAEAQEPAPPAAAESPFGNPGAPKGKSVVSALSNMAAPKPSDPFEAALAGTLDLALGPLGGTAPKSEVLSFEPTPSKGAAPSFGGPAASFEDPLAGLDLDAPSGTPTPGPDPTQFLADDNSGAEFDLGFGKDDATHVTAPSPAPVPEPAAAPAPVAATPAVASRAAKPISEAPPPPEDKSVFSLIFNGLGFAVVVGVIFFAFVAYRNGGRIDLRELGKAMSTAFGMSTAPGGALDLPVLVSGSGYYPTVADSDLMFVSGSVTNAGAKPLRIQVNLEVVDAAGRALAHGRGWPGRVPTPEDLFNIGNPLDLDKLNQRLLQDAPPAVAPGATASFVVVVTKPACGEDCELKVHAEPFKAPTAAAAHAGPAAGKPSEALSATAAAGR